MIFVLLFRKKKKKPDVMLLQAYVFSQLVK